MSLRSPLDLRLYLVTDAPERCRYGLLETVKRAVQGGVTVVQYRREHADHETMLQEARPLREYLRSVGIPFIVNNEVELARELDADGVHVGQGDMPAAEVRRRVGEKMRIGLSVSNESEMRAVDPAVVDYVGCGPVFSTATKPDAAPAVGVEGWAALSALSPLPLVAIGGINVERARAIRAAGRCDGVAVVSAICAAEDPADAAEQLLSTQI
ncbi:MAG: thiamine phosphate synthase [Akkermansia sp.]|nr:thiamine phosphate synthase [Akkermansia sp.]